MAIIATLNTVFMAETGELEAAYKSMARLQADASRVIDQARGPLGEYMNQVDRLGAIYDEGAISQEDYNTAMRQAREAYESAIGPTAEMISEQERLAAQAEQTKIAIAAAEQSVRRWEAAMERGREVTQANLTPTERYEQELMELDKLLRDNVISMDTFFRASQRAFNTMTAGVPKVSRFGDGIRRLGTDIRMSIASNLAAALSIREIVRAVADGFEAVDTLHDVAEATGATTEQISALHVAAQLSASSSEAIDDALKKLNKTLGSAEDSKAISESLDAIGLSAGYLRSIGVGRAFAEISDALKGIEDPATRAKIANDLFGKSGSDLLNVLALGSEGLNEAAAQAEAFGVSINSIDAANVNEAGDAVTRVKLALDGLTQQAAIVFAPIVEWLATNIPVAIKYGQIAFINMFESLANEIKSVLDLVSYLPDWLGGGMATDASLAIDTYIEELTAAENKLRDELATLDSKGKGSGNKMFSVEASSSDFFASITTSVGEMATSVTGILSSGAQSAIQQADSLVGLIEQKKKQFDEIKKLAESVLESTMTPMEKFEKTMADLQRLRDVNAISPDVFLRGQAAALNDLDKATGKSASDNKNAALERGTAAAFAAEREKDSPVKTQKEILEQAKKQTDLQQKQLDAFKEGGAVPVNF